MEQPIRIEVQATQPGFYMVYRNPGDKFIITREGDFSRNWMLRLSPPVQTVPHSVVVPTEEPVFVAAMAPEPPAAAVAEKPKRKYVRKNKQEGV